MVDMTESLFPSQVYSARLTRAAGLAADRGIGGLVFERTVRGVKAGCH